ncbi:uncharacterized protein LOC133797904 isoform X2 [Humulus lupulus]|uniref:uncharacterized protein LOC133797904 isoform X2 n=1 Tax=Humulus lupulus TaxID=3486 RepID=UPI002B40974B|nr:uncharacterized protein LOC133797904 isoform X2 [Humulus lupulus]
MMILVEKIKVVKIEKKMKIILILRALVEPKMLVVGTIKNKDDNVALKILEVADFATEVENVLIVVAEIDKEVASQFPMVVELATEVSPHLLEVAVSATKVVESATEVASHFVSHIPKFAELGTDVAPKLPEVALDLLEVAELAKVAEDVNEVAQVVGTIASQSFFDSLSDTVLEEAYKNAINVVKAIKTTEVVFFFCSNYRFCFFFQMFNFILFLLVYSYFFFIGIYSSLHCYFSICW